MRVRVRVKRAHLAHLALSRSLALSPLLHVAGWATARVRVRVRVRARAWAWARARARARVRVRVRVKA